jgi:hypothetical protein
MTPSAGDSDETGLPELDLPRVPDSAQMWRRAMALGVVCFLLFLLDRLTVVLMDYWLFEALGFAAVFQTNFQAGLSLFLWGFGSCFLAIALPSILHGVGAAGRRLVVSTAILSGLLLGYLLTGRYQEILLLLGSLPVGEVDPVFGRDVGFYMFELPGYWTIWLAVAAPLSLGLVAHLTFLLLGRHRLRRWHAAQRGRFAALLADIATPAVLLHVALLGLLAAVGVWLSRFDLLWKDNYSSAVFTGADYVDVSGLLSYLNHYALRALLVLAASMAILLALARLRSFLRRGGSVELASLRARRLVYALACLLAVDLGFASLVLIRDVTMVSPNEPVIQLPYIERHIQATLRGYGLDRVETVEFLPAGLGDPLPSAEELLASPTLRNVPLWPGWVSYLERVLDPQHADRVLLTGGDSLVYGPTLDALRAQQKLRSYYDFLDMDTLRYRDRDGEVHLLVSAARELPFTDPQPWIAWWGQRMLLFTHGHGLVMAPASEVRGAGDPSYHAHGIPTQSEIAELALDNPSLYYGEGAGVMMGFSNAAQVSEFDYPTDEDRQEVNYPASVDGGVPVNSFLRRLVVGWRSSVPLDVWFSGLVTGGTRVHYARRPLERLDRIAPFLYYDSDPVAVPHEGRIHWLVNAMTTSDRYPYSRLHDLGDQSIQQSFELRTRRRVNYVRDALKVVIDGYTGKVSFYRVADEPVMNTWANVYPTLFREREAMPEALRAHAQYPVQLMHIQFDDVYYEYHMTDPLTFFNMEDMWDDADEVKGAVLAEGDSVTFSVEPRFWIAETGGVLPQAQEPTQFVLSMVFTNEQALNLRAVPIAYQDGPDYGRLVVLRVPKGRFYPGPEQADAAIDQDPQISEQISWWNRTGSSVIRGHTSTLIVGNDVIYVEPLFIRSRQNPVSQLRRVIVVFRGIAAVGLTLEDALRKAMAEAETSRPEGHRSEVARAQASRKGIVAPGPTRELTVDRHDALAIAAEHGIASPDHAELAHGMWEVQGKTKVGMRIEVIIDATDGRVLDIDYTHPSPHSRKSEGRGD